MMTLEPNKKELKSYRSKLRKRMPEPEKVLWEEIRSKKLDVKFRRQFSFGSYVVDFYSPQIKLILEIDGKSHYRKKVITEDRLRDQALSKKGIKVLRISNEEVLNEIDSALNRIKKEIKKRV